MDQLIHPAFPDCENCIVFCADNNYMALTAVAVQSILENRNAAEKYDIVILHSGISEEHIAQYGKMSGGYESFSVRCINICKYIEGRHFFTENRKDISKEAYYRLVIPWVLDDRYHRALYLDGDMIVRRDVMPLFQTELDGMLIAAVRDYWGICNCYIPGDDRRAYRESIGLHDIDNYVISATVLFDLDGIREKHNMESVLALCTSKQWRQHDQDVLNVLFYRQIELLSPNWGFVADYGNNHFLPDTLLAELAAINDPAIYHFATSRKPYKRYASTFDAEFWLFASHTCYFGALLKKSRDTHRTWLIVGDLDKTFIKAERAPFQQIRLDNLAMLERRNAYAKIHKIEIKNSTLHMDGSVVVNECNLDAPVQVMILANDILCAADKQYTENALYGPAKQETFRGEYFAVTYKLSPLTQAYNISLAAKTAGGMIRIKQVSQGLFSPVTTSVNSSYYYADGWTVQQRGENLEIRQCSPAELSKHERDFKEELFRHKGIAGKKAVLIRSFARFLREHKKKPVWLISDRVNRADDNGEAFFKYVNREHAHEILSFFLISRESPDYKRLKEYGKVVPLYSYRHKILALTADWSISSQVDEVFRHPFRGYRYCYADILSSGRFAFLQHGITTPDKDVSTFLKKSAKQINGFVVSTKSEYELITNGSCHYDEDEVWLTGLPRFDYLEDKNEKIITVMPTWRSNLAIRQDHDTGIWSLREDFQSSEYVTFYRNLMQHPGLREAAKKLGYKIQFKIHPSYPQDGSIFGFDADTAVVPSDVSYRDIYASSSLIVSDYSSSIFDFLYLRKPIIYCQFDINTFYKAHIYKEGHADFEREGFGEVLYSLDETVAKIIEYMENGCELKPLYRERIDKFFAFNDRDNCKRVYEAIKRKRETM